jgi:hypothetical protein
MKYILLKDRFEHKAGTTVYFYTGPTYGLVSEDTFDSGIEHLAVTLKPDGTHPFFTVAIDELEVF